MSSTPHHHPDRRPGKTTCTECDGPILRAIDPDGTLLTLDPHQDNIRYAAWQEDGIARCRPIRSILDRRSGEVPLSIHPADCGVPLADVIRVDFGRRIPRQRDGRRRAHG